MKLSRKFATLLTLLFLSLFLQNCASDGQEAVEDVKLAEEKGTTEEAAEVGEETEVGQSSENIEEEGSFDEGSYEEAAEEMSTQPEEAPFKATIEEQSTEETLETTKEPNLEAVYIDTESHTLVNEDKLNQPVALNEELKNTEADATSDLEHMQSETEKSSTAQNEMSEADAMTQSFEYTIEKGDWLSKIAKRIYGDMNKWQIIAKANPYISNPDLIYTNKKLQIPVINNSAKEFMTKYKGALAKAREDIQDKKNKFAMIKINKGDSLSKLAQKHLGSKTKWKSLWSMNKDLLKNQNQLQVGELIRIPI